MKETVEKLKSLGDETRLRIYRLLSEKGELCVCNITETLGITQTHASRSLGVLKNAGLVSDRRDGLWMHYSAVKEGGNSGIIRFIMGITRGDKTVKNDLKKAAVVVKNSSGCGKYCEKRKKR